MPGFHRPHRKRLISARPPSQIHPVPLLPLDTSTIQFHSNASNTTLKIMGVGGIHVWPPCTLLRDLLDSRLLYSPWQGGPNTDGAGGRFWDLHHTLWECLYISLNKRCHNYYGYQEIYHIGPPPSWSPGSGVAWLQGRRSLFLAVIRSHVGFHGIKWQMWDGGLESPTRSSIIPWLVWSPITLCSP